MSQFSDVIYRNDTLHISCAVDYSGILAPEIIWYPAPDNSPSVDNTGSSVNSTISITATAPLVSVPPYTCYVSFSGSVFPDADNRTSKSVSISGEWSVYFFSFAFSSLLVATQR